MHGSSACGKHRTTSREIGSVDLQGIGKLVIIGGLALAAPGVVM
ncbi:MAG TPA: hypothetical protein VFH17_01975 [Coriobacteriia bacterium]|nr:hypothetical protein [Coriobacteriia bacterium]